MQAANTEKSQEVVQKTEMQQATDLVRQSFGVLYNLINGLPPQLLERSFAYKCLREVDMWVNEGLRAAAQLEAQLAKQQKSIVMPSAGMMATPKIPM